MKALIPLLIVSTSALAVTTVQYAQRASTERQRADEAQVLVQKHEVRIRELQQAQNNLDQQLQEAHRPAQLAMEQSMTAAVRPALPIPKTAPPRPPVPAMALLSRVEAGSGGGLALRNGQMAMNPMQQLSPAAQRFMKYQMKNGMRRHYEGLDSAMGMSQEQADKLVDLIVEQQTRTITETRKLNVDMNEAMKAAQARKAHDDAEIAALIGQDKLPLWDQFQKSMPDRAQVNMVSEQLQNMGTPLTDDQRARLLDIVTEQRQSNPRPTQELPPEEMVAQWTKWQDESERALLERAKSVLSPEQYARYRDYQEWQSEMRQNSMMFRAMPGASGSVSATSSYIVADPPASGQK
jgi:hypothetical protein